MRRVVFPQCHWGLSAKKLTCISGTAENLEDFDVEGTGTCSHAFHEPLIGLDEQGRFKTRKAQTYPRELCQKLAQCFIDSWKQGKGNPILMEMEEALKLLEGEEEESEYGLVAPGWDAPDPLELSAKYAADKGHSLESLAAKALVHKAVKATPPCAVISLRTW